MKQFFGYFWGVIVHPRAAFDGQARQSSNRPAIILMVFSLLLGSPNFLKTVLFNRDWLGTRREFLALTLVGFFGCLQVEFLVPVFFIALVPIIRFLELLVLPGLAHVLSKLWHSRGTFEGSVDTLGFALGVPAIVIHSTTELVFSVPTNLISGHPYRWAPSMNGEFAPVVAALWNFYVIGIYSFACDLWIIVLGAIAIHRVQGIPWWTAALISPFGSILWWYGTMATFLR